MYLDEVYDIFLYYCLRLIKSIILVESNFTNMLLSFFEIKISSSVGYTINEWHVQVGIGDRTLSRTSTLYAWVSTNTSLIFMKDSLIKIHNGYCNIEEILKLLKKKNNQTPIGSLHIDGFIG